MELDKCEQRILDMLNAGMTRQEAEFAVAIELGEIPGDVIEVDDDAGTDDATDKSRAPNVSPSCSICTANAPACCRRTTILNAASARRSINTATRHSLLAKQGAAVLECG